MARAQFSPFRRAITFSNRNTGRSHGSAVATFEIAGDKP
jgi:hypothetical protein